MLPAFRKRMNGEWMTGTMKPKCLCRALKIPLRCCCYLCQWFHQCRVSSHIILTIILSTVDLVATNKRQNNNIVRQAFWHVVYTHNKLTCASYENTWTKIKKIQFISALVGCIGILCRFRQLPNGESFELNGENCRTAFSHRVDWLCVLSVKIRCRLPFIHIQAISNISNIRKWTRPFSKQKNAVTGRRAKERCEVTLYSFSRIRFMRVSLLHWVGQTEWWVTRNGSKDNDSETKHDTRTPKRPSLVKHFADTCCDWGGLMRVKMKVIESGGWVDVFSGEKKNMIFYELREFVDFSNSTNLSWFSITKQNIFTVSNALLPVSSFARLHIFIFKISKNIFRKFLLEASINLHAIPIIQDSRRRVYR